MGSAKHCDMTSFVLAALHAHCEPVGSSSFVRHTPILEKTILRFDVPSAAHVQAGAPDEPG